MDVWKKRENMYISIFFSLDGFLANLHKKSELASKKNDIIFYKSEKDATSKKLGDLLSCVRVCQIRISYGEANRDTKHYEIRPINFALLSLY